MNWNIFSVLSIYTDPMDILYDVNANEIPTLSSLEFAEIAYIIKAAIYVVALISISCSLIGLLYMRNANHIAESKQDITHKLWIVFIAGSSVFLFNILKTFFDSFFY